MSTLNHLNKRAHPRILNSIYRVLKIKENQGIKNLQSWVDSNWMEIKEEIDPWMITGVSRPRATAGDSQ